MSYKGSISAAILTLRSSSLVKWLQSERSTITGFSMASWSRWRSCVVFEIILNGVRVPLAGLPELASWQTTRNYENKRDMNWAQKSIFELSPHMSMVPVCAILSGFPLVCEGRSRLDRLLGNSRYTIWQWLTDVSTTIFLDSYPTMENLTVWRMLAVVKKEVAGFCTYSIPWKCIVVSNGRWLVTVNYCCQPCEDFWISFSTPQQ